MMMMMMMMMKRMMVVMMMVMVMVMMTMNTMKDTCYQSTRHQSRFASVGWAMTEPHYHNQPSGRPLCLERRLELARQPIPETDGTEVNEDRAPAQWVKPMRHSTKGQGTGSTVTICRGWTREQRRQVWYRVSIPVRKLLDEWQRAEKKKDDPSHFRDGHQHQAKARRRRTTGRRGRAWEKRRTPAPKAKTAPGTVHLG